MLASPYFVTVAKLNSILLICRDDAIPKDPQVSSPRGGEEGGRPPRSLPATLQYLGWGLGGVDAGWGSFHSEARVSRAPACACLRSPPGLSVFLLHITVSLKMGYIWNPTK